MFQTGHSNTRSEERLGKVGELGFTFRLKLVIFGLELASTFDMLLLKQVGILAMISRKGLGTDLRLTLFFQLSLGDFVKHCQFSGSFF